MRDHRTGAESSLPEDYIAYRETVQESFTRRYDTDRDPWSRDLVKGRITQFLLESAPAAQVGRRRRVLDIGCGRGMQTAQLADALDADVVGVDLIDVWDPPAISRGSLQFQLGDFREVQVRPLDYLVDVGCLHHQRREDWVPWVRHGAGLLTAGGVWAVSIFLSPDGAVVDKQLADGRSNWWLTEDLMIDLFRGCGFTHLASQKVDRNFHYEGHWLKYLTLAFSRVGVGS